MIRPVNIDFRQEGDDSFVLRFLTETGENLEVALTGALLSSVLAYLSASAPGPVSIRSLLLDRAPQLEPIAYEVQARMGGGRRLVLTCRIPDSDRTLTIPLELSADDVELLIREME